MRSTVETVVIMLGHCCGPECGRLDTLFLVGPHRYRCRDCWPKEAGQPVPDWMLELARKGPSRDGRVRAGGAWS